MSSLLVTNQKQNAKNETPANEECIYISIKKTVYAKNYFCELRGIIFSKPLPLLQVVLTSTLHIIIC